jgi:D-beta-D-heptose 7-phosphate kinase / D-beta-D-heptose 1-phosphate adenosyltransferase
MAVSAGFFEPARDDVQGILAAMRGRRVAVVGDVMLDAYLMGVLERISPEAPVPVLEATSERYTVGGAANVARCLVELGAEVRLSGVVGTDREGARLTALAQQLGLDVGGLVSDESRPTTCKTRLMAGCQQVLRLDRESRAAVGGDVARQLLEQTVAACRWADAVVLSDYAKGVLSAALCRAAIESAGDTPVVVDPKTLPWDHYRGATVIKPNCREAQKFAATSVDSDAQAGAVAGQLAGRLAITHALITRGAAGITLAARRDDSRDGGFDTVHFPARPHELVDVTGAGDVVTATLALSLAAGAELRLGTWLANVAAGVKVGKLGTAPVSADEILAAVGRPLGCGQKLRARPAAAAWAAELRRRGRRVVFTNGCFDLLHVGHVRYLERSRALGDVLIVGVNTDASVRRLKGPERPLQPEADRAQIVASQASVDAVVLFDEDTPWELIRALRPDVLTKGADYGTAQNVVGWDLVESWNGQVVLIDLVAGRSTTALIKRAA